MCGVGWILRDDKGTTILHSRLAFSNVGSQKEAELMAIQWAVCDMVYTRQQKIIFESSCVLARDVLTASVESAESAEWRHLRTDIHLHLRALQDWSFHHCGGPTWLLQRIESEAAT